MEKRTVGIWLKGLYVGLICLAGCFGTYVRAQGVPAAIKYQAVLRDVEGEPMANRDGLAVRITLRQGMPGGDILYQETHTELATDAFGLLQLEIGRGTVSVAAYGSLLDIPWENSPIYAEVEVQADDNGYTMMGASELLSVPYALYAGNASVGMGLTDGYLPKYDAGYMNLVDSKISETPGGVLQFYAGDDAYTFPTKRGGKNQSLTLIDDEGTLGWRTGGGGGGADCDGCQDGYLTYWDDVNGNGMLRTSDMRYDEPTGAVYAGSQFISPELMIVEKELEINATVSGKHNLQYNELPRYNVWVGEADGRSKAYVLGSGVTIDSSDKAKPVLQFGGGSSVWVYRPEGAVDYVHTKIDPAKSVRVGIGTDSPKTRLQVKDGSFLLSGTDGGSDEPDEWTAGNHLYWHSGKGALRMGKFDQDQAGLWNAGNLGANSIALGTNAVATEADNVAIGKDAKAQAEMAMACGRNAAATGKTSLALGTTILVSQANAIGIGSSQGDNVVTFEVAGARGIGIGYEVKNHGEEAMALGQNNEVAETGANSIVIGSRNAAKGEYNIMIGSEIETGGEVNAHGLNENIQIGKQLRANTGMGMINIGFSNVLERGTGGVCLGTGLKIKNDGISLSGINIGNENTITTNEPAGGNTAIGPVLIGQKLSIDNEQGGVILGRYNNQTLAFWDAPALVVGVGTSGQHSNVLELSEKGELHLLGTKSSIDVKTVNQTSDLNLKTDIQPLNADFSVLQALQPVRYRFKADKDQQLQFGFIAQDVERYFPHLVHTGNKGLKSLNYIGLLPVLWQYTQQLEQTVETQAAELEQMKTELETLKTELEAIKAAVGLGE